MKNWAGNLTFSAKEYLEVNSISKLQSIVNKSTGVKVIAAGHSFNDIANTSHTHISLKNMSSQIEIDSNQKIALVPAGMSYADVCKFLEKYGWALSNTASLGEISMAGAILTATHGSGSENSILSECVVGIEMVLASGEIYAVDQDESDEFQGLVVSLGGLGVLTKFKVRIVKSFSIKQYVYENIGLEALAQNFDLVFNKAYSVSYFSNWAKNSTGQVWMKFLDDGSPIDVPYLFLDGNLATSNQHPVKANDPSSCTQQMGESGKWLYRLPHFKLGSSPASGDEVQTEYLVDRAHVREYISSLSLIGDEISDRVYATEIRAIKEDNLWLSPAYNRATIGFHFTWKKSESLQKFLQKIEEILGKHNGRPHWGKLFVTSRENLVGRYPKFSDFERILMKYDPNKKFRNSFIDRYFVNY